MIKPVANAELSNSDNRALEHPSWRLSLSGFQQLRGAGDRRQQAQKGKEGGHILDGDGKENASHQVSALFRNWLSPGVAVESVPSSGERAVCLPASCPSLARLPSGWSFGFVCQPILPACLCVSFHPHLLTDPVLHLNDLQNVRAVLGLSEKRKDWLLFFPFLAPIHSIHNTQLAPFLCWPQCQVLGIDRDMVFAFMEFKIKHWLFRTGYPLCGAWYKMNMQGPLFENYYEFPNSVGRAPNQAPF